MDERVVCPACGREVRNVPDVRQGRVMVDVDGEFREMGVVSIGFRCPECRHVWGHDERVGKWTESAR